MLIDRRKINYKPSLLCYDANLYQYHLLHGVLTINEVRATLGLEPVAWGDEPTGRTMARGPGDGSLKVLGGRDGDPADEEPESDEEEADRRVK